MRKKVASIVLALIGCVVIVGCGKTDNNEIRKADSKVTTESEKDVEFEYEISDIDGENYKIHIYSGSEESVVIPDEYEEKLVVEVDNRAFSNTQMKKVQLGSNVQIIGEYAFSSNPNLKEVVFDDKLKEIKEFAFLHSGLTGNVVIPDSVETIGTSAFGLTKVNSVEFGTGIKYIAGGAFTGDTDLKKVTFNNMDVEFEDETVFTECSNLTIIAPKGSTAEKYAKDNNINFEER